MFLFSEAPNLLRRGGSFWWPKIFSVFIMVLRTYSLNSSTCHHHHHHHQRARSCFAVLYLNVFFFNITRGLPWVLLMPCISVFYSQQKSVCCPGWGGVQRASCSSDNPHSEGKMVRQHPHTVGCVGHRYFRRKNKKKKCSSSAIRGGVIFFFFAPSFCSGPGASRARVTPPCVFLAVVVAFLLRTHVVF